MDTAGLDCAGPSLGPLHGEFWCFPLTARTPQLRGKLHTHHGGTQPPSGKAVTSGLEGTDLVSVFGTRESWRAGGGGLRFHRPEPSVALRGRGGRPKQLPEGQHLDPSNTRGAEKKASGCASGGVAKLPVPLGSCFRREPEDAVCGRNSGLTAGRPAALDWKVSLGLGLATALS